MTGEVRSVVVGGRQLRAAVRPGRAAAGGKPPLLLVNGIGVRLEMLGPLVRELDPDVEVIMFDPPGIGGSALPCGPYRCTGLWRLIAAMLPVVQPGRAAFSLPLGEMFSIVVYAQLILEQVKIAKVDQDVVNQMFDFVVRDFAHFALQIYDNYSTQEAQRTYCKDIMLIRAVPDHEQYTRLWKHYVAALNGEYAMNP